MLAARGRHRARRPFPAKGTPTESGLNSPFALCHRLSTKFPVWSLQSLWAAATALPGSLAIQGTLTRERNSGARVSTAARLGVVGPETGGSAAMGPAPVAHGIICILTSHHRDILPPLKD